MSDITLFNKEGKILASSREVAEKFGNLIIMFLGILKILFLNLTVQIWTVKCL